MPLPYEVMKERITMWGLDEQVKQMTLSNKYDMDPVPIEDIFAPLPKQDSSPESKDAVYPLEELHLPPMHREPAPSVAVFKVTRHGGTSLHLVHLSNLE